MVLLASSFDQSKYLNAGDLAQEKALRIKSVTVETVRTNTGQGQKPVLWFTNHNKGLVLNITNNRVLRSAFGDDIPFPRAVGSHACLNSLAGGGAMTAA